MYSTRSERLHFLCDLERQALVVASQLEEKLAQVLGEKVQTEREKNNKLSPGGKKGGTGGRPTLEAKAIQEAAQDIARKFIEDRIIPVLETYFKLAKGQLMTITRTMKDGSKTRTRKLSADPATTRHFVERLVPAARQGLDVTMGTPEEFYKAIQEAKLQQQRERQEQDGERVIH